MKKAMPAAVLGLTALLLSGCQNTGSLEYIIGHSDYFDVKVEEVSEDRFRGMSEKLGEVEVLLGGSLNSRSYTDIRAGDLLEVFYDGTVLETVPLQVPEAEAVMLVQPADHIGTLRIAGLSSVRVSAFPGISMSVVEGFQTPSGATLIIENLESRDVEGGSKGDYLLQIEQMGSWYDLERADLSFSAEAYLYKPGVPVREDLDWSGIYGELPRGHYRIIKRFREALGEPGHFRTWYLAAEFEI